MIQVCVMKRSFFLAAQTTACLEKENNRQYFWCFQTYLRQICFFKRHEINANKIFYLCLQISRPVPFFANSLSLDTYTPYSILSLSIVLCLLFLKNVMLFEEKQLDQKWALHCHYYMHSQYRINQFCNYY